MQKTDSNIFIKKHLELILTLCLGIGILINNIELLIGIFCNETGDYALNAIATIDAINFKQLVGSYSRLHFFHPGPILFYWRALFEKICTFVLSPFQSHFLSQLTINLLIFYNLLKLIKKNLSNDLTIIIFSIIISISLGILVKDVWVDTWNPTAIVIPMCGLILGSSFYLFWGNGLHITFICILICLHAHLSTLPTIIAISALQLIFNKNRVSKDFNIIIIFSLIIFIPMILEFIFNNGGNTLVLVRTLLKNKVIHRDILSSIKFIYNNVVIGIIVIGVYSIYKSLINDNKLTFNNVIFIFSNVGLLSSLPVVYRTPGILYPYIFYYVNAFYVTLLISIILPIITSKTFGNINLYILSIATLFIIGLKIPTTSAPFRYNKDCINEEFFKKYFSNIRISKPRLELFPKSEKIDWYVAAAIALKAKRDNINYCIKRKDWDYIFGKTYSCS
jgi:hypothetical protein